MAGLANSPILTATVFRESPTRFWLRPGLTFAEALSAERFARIFAKHGDLFGVGAIYSTAVMV